MRSNDRATLLMLIAVLLFASTLHRAGGGAAAAEAPRARAIEFDEKVVYHSPERPGFAAWVQLWPERTPGELSIKFLERRRPKPGASPPPPLDVHQYEAIGLPIKYDFRDLVTEVVYLRSTDGAATWKETGRTTETELHRSSNSGCFSPVRVPDGRLLSLSWGMPGCVRESSDDGISWRIVRELMDPAHFDVAPFQIRLLSDGRTLVIFCPFNTAWGPGKPLPGRLHSKPSVRSAWQAALIFSTDLGKTFTPPLPIYPGVPVTESDFCELPSGDLLFLHAQCFGGTAHRQIVRRTKFGWVPDVMEAIDARAPETFVRTSHGYLVGASRNDAYVWSDDDGATWQPLADIKRGEYQPRALLLNDDRILFVWHKGADQFYGESDMYIGQHTFKLKVDHPRPRSRLKLARAFDQQAGKYINAFDATLTTAANGKPIAGKPIEFSRVARGAKGYAEFGGATPWIDGAKTRATTDADGVARIAYPEDDAITDIHQSFQIAARFDPNREDAQYLPSTSLTIEYYAVTPTAAKP
jgi:hypothetical protein